MEQINRAEWERETEMVRIAILDDMENDRKKLEAAIRGYFNKKGTEYEYEAALFSESGALYMELEDKKYFDLFLLDMEMPDCSGLQAAQVIRDHYMEPFIFYVTNYVEYAVQAFEVNAYRYIPKVMIEEKLPEALDALLPKIAQLDKRAYIVEWESGVEKILYRDIFYIRKEGKYINIVHRNGERRIRKTLQEIVAELNSEEFFYVDKGCVVNIRHILSCQKGQVNMRDHTVLPLSRPRYRAVKERVAAYWREES